MKQILSPCFPTGKAILDVFEAQKVVLENRRNSGKYILSFLDNYYNAPKIKISLVSIWYYIECSENLGLYWQNILTGSRFLSYIYGFDKCKGIFRNLVSRSKTLSFQHVSCISSSGARVSDTI